MKNHLTLIIASVLLILCVLEKQASYKAERNVNVENMYNFPVKNINSDPTASDKGVAEIEKGNSLYNPSSTFQFVSADSTTENSSDKTLSQSLVNISARITTANY